MIEPINFAIEDTFNEASFQMLVDSAATEADSLFSIPEDKWKVESVLKHGSVETTIYSLPVVINNNKKAPPVLSISIRLGVNADEFFKFLTTTVEGYKYLDPDSDPSHFNVPISGPFSLPGHSLSKAQAEYTTLKIPLCTMRDYVVMNAHDFSRRRWYCKSILLDDKYTGHTGYTGTGPVASHPGGCVRMGYISCYWVQDLPEDVDGKSCLLRVFQWIDMGGWLSSISAGANTSYFKPFIQRSLEKYPIDSSHIRK